MLLACGPVALYRLVNRLQEIPVKERLGQKLDGPRFHRPHRRRHIAVARNKNNGNLNVTLGHPLLQIESAEPGELHVQH